MTPGQTPAGSSGMKLTGSRMSCGIPQTRQTTTSGQTGRPPRVESQSLSWKMGTEYTFEVRGLGETRAGVGDLHGPSASTAAMMAVPSPTLPEIAMLLLAMLLLGSGAYLLRRRQSGGLTPA